MGQTVDKVRLLVGSGAVVVSAHGYDELAEDDIFAKDIVAGAKDAVLVEDYSEYRKGPCVLVLQGDRDGSPIHVVWGIPKDAISPVVVVTSYSPGPDQWTADSLKRRK